MRKICAAWKKHDAQKGKISFSKHRKKYQVEGSMLDEKGKRKSVGYYFTHACTTKPAKEWNRTAVVEEDQLAVGVSKVRGRWQARIRAGNVNEDGTEAHVGRWVQNERQARRKRRLTRNHVGKARQVDVEECMDAIVTYKKRSEQEHPGKATIINKYNYNILLYKSVLLHLSTCTHSHYIHYTLSTAKIVCLY